MRTGAPFNPFALDQHRAGVLPFFFPEGRTTTELLSAARGAAGVGQILGPEGTGKSTLLHAIALSAKESEEAVEEIRAAADGKIQPFSSEARVLCVDEADRISWWRRAWLVRHCRRHGQALIMATRKDLGVPTLWQCVVDEALMTRIVEAVLDRSPELPRIVSAERAPEALRECGGNARSALLRMYDWYEASWEQEHTESPGSST